MPLYHIKETWTHDFCCLPSTDQTKTPSASQTEALKQAGLGKTKIVFKNKLASHSEVCNILEEHFPQLKNYVGFTLHRAKVGGQNRPLFDLQVTWFYSKKSEESSSEFGVYFCKTIAKKRRVNCKEGKGIRVGHSSVVFL